LEVPWRNGFLRQVEQGFSSFFGLIFGIFDDLSKWSATKVSAKLGNISNMTKIQH